MASTQTQSAKQSEPEEQLKEDGTRDYSAGNPDADYSFGGDRSKLMAYYELIGGDRGFKSEEAKTWVEAGGVRWSDKSDVGRKFGPDRDGLLIPYFDLDGKPVVDLKTGRPFERVRLLRYSGRGKYRSEAGTGVHAYLPMFPTGHASWREVFKDPDFPVALTEGEFKAGQGTWVPGGMPTIGLGGIDCLTTRQGGLVPELEGIVLKGRTVFIVFDAPTNEHLAASVSRAANFLMVRGAKVKVCSIENTEVYQRQAWDKDCGMTLKEFHDAGGTNKMGLDDFLRWGGKWNELTASAVEVENTIDQNTLFVSLALLTGPASPLYLHLTGKDAGTIRNKQAMSEVLSDELIWRETRGGVKPVNAFKEWCESPRRVKLNEVVVRPDLPPLSPTPDNNWNSWPGLVTLPLRNDALAAYFNGFLDEWFSPGVEDPGVALLHRDSFKQWCAALFQQPGKRPFTSWTFISKHEGIGKSALFELIAKLIGVGVDGGAYLATADDLESEWTDYLYGKQFILYNEPSNSNAKLRQKVKNLRTDDYLNCNTKFGPKFRIPNLVAFAFTTNEDYAFGLSEEARRDWVWEPKWQQSDKDWLEKARKFGELACGTGPDSEAFRSAVLFDLTYQTLLSNYDPHAPAGNSKAKTRAAKASTSLVGLRKEELLERVLELLQGTEETPAEKAVAWTTESWLDWSGVEKHYAHADKVWLNGQLEKFGHYAGSETYKVSGNNKPRIWFVASVPWSDLNRAEKQRAVSVGLGEDPDDVVGLMGGTK